MLDLSSGYSCTEHYNITACNVSVMLSPRITQKEVGINFPAIIRALATQSLLITNITTTPSNMPCTSMYIGKNTLRDKDKTQVFNFDEAPNIPVKYHRASLSYFLSGAGRQGRHWRGLTNHSSASAALDQSGAGPGLTRPALGTPEPRSENTRVSRDQGLAVITRRLCGHQTGNTGPGTDNHCT